MKINIKYKLFFIAFFSCSFIMCNDIPIKNRFLVPIYFDIGLSIGYNDNVFKFSESEKNDNSSLNYMGNADTYDSSFLKPDVKIIYSPQIFNKNVTNFVFNSFSSSYLDVIDKNNRYYSLRFEYKIKPYNWVKFGYKSGQNYFLRYYDDKDIPEDNFSKCNYDKESIYFSYSFSIKPLAGWHKLFLSKSTECFNPSFTEFDLDITDISYSYFFKYRSFDISFILSNRFADNISYNNGLSSTGFDRSYDGSKYGIRITKKNFQDFFKKATLGYYLNVRDYVSESTEDPLHSGRSHVEHSLSLSFLKEVRNNVNIELKYKLRYRQTNSDYDWVESLKTFSDNQILVKIIYNMGIDLFY